MIDGISCVLSFLWTHALIIDLFCIKMYEKDGCLLLGSSASALHSNLRIYCVKSGEYRATVIHKSTVNTLNWTSSDRHQIRRQIQCKSAAGKKAYVQQVYDEEGNFICSWQSDANTDGSFLKVFTTSKEGRIAVGTAQNGSIALLSLGSRSLTLNDRIRTDHQSGISALVFGNEVLVSGGEDGRVYVHGSRSPFDRIQAFESYGFPCCGIVTWKDTVLVAYGSGHLRLFDLAAGTILAEITAHSRWITALNIAENSGLVITTSEDSFVRIWELKSSQESIVQLKFSESIPDVRLCGGSFFEDDGKGFALTGYEQEEIICYSM